MSLSDTIHETFGKLLHAKRERRKPENVNVQHREEMTIHDRFAVLITGCLGTMWAVYALCLVMVAWIGLQFLIDPFDPYPFVFLMCLTSIFQMLLLPLLLVGQNIQSRHSELRAEEQYKTTIDSYRDVEQILANLDAQNHELIRQTDLLKRLLDQHQSGSTTIL